MTRGNNLRLKVALIAACLLASTPVSLAQAEATFTPQTFSPTHIFDLESAGDPQVSPDGQWIAYVRRSADIMTDRYVSSIWAVSSDGKTHYALVEGEGSFVQPRWSPNGRHLLYSASANGKSEARVLDVASRASWSLGQFEGAPQSAGWSPDGRLIAFTLFVEGKGPAFASPVKRPSGAQWAPPARLYDQLNVHMDGAGFLKPGATQVFVVPVEGGTARKLTQGDVSYSRPVWLTNETLLVSGNAAEDADLDPRESEIYAVSVKTGSVSQLTDRRGPDGSPVPSPDGRRIAFIGYDDQQITWQTPALYVMDADGTNRRLLTAELDRPVSSPQWAPDGKSIYATFSDQGRVVLARISLSGDVTRIADDLGSGAGGRPYVGGSFSIGGEGRNLTIAYTQGRADRPSEIAVLRGNGAAKTLTDLNTDALGHLSLPQIHHMPVTSSVDGLAIDAWVALPVGYVPGQRYPTILEIHGGPATMYGAGFATDVQRFAAEGFVTVWANQRGSVGYGEDFALLIDRNYPDDDGLNDLLSVLDEAITRGYSDPDRLFVTGGSAGGAMTAWAVGSTDRFAAAAAVNPVINWTSVMLFGDTAAHVARHQVRGFPWDNLDLFWKQSPLSRAGNVTTPTLLMVGDNDWRTPPAEAEQFYTALKLQGKQALLVRIPEAGHGIGARPSQNIEKTENIIGWFRAHDPGAKTTVGQGE